MIDITFTSMVLGKPRGANLLLRDTDEDWESFRRLARLVGFPYLPDQWLASLEIEFYWPGHDNPWGFYEWYNFYMNDSLERLAAKMIQNTEPFFLEGRKEGLH